MPSAREDPRRALGKLGEELALKHLQARGLELLARNHRTRHGEIDLIVSDGRAIVFVEVKSRQLARGAPNAPQPLEGLGHRQRVRLRRLASAWLREATLERRPQELRFDAIGVVVDRAGALVRLDHVEGAW